MTDYKDRGGREQNPPRPPQGGGGGHNRYDGSTITVGGITYRYDAATGKWIPISGQDNTTSNSSGGGGGFGGGGGGFVLTTVTGRKLSQAQVDALKADFKHIGNLYGVTLGGGTLTHLVKMDLSTQEVLTRIQAIQKVNENKVFLQQFSASLGKTWNKKQMRDFVLGAAPKDFYAKYEEALGRTGLVNAGLSIGHGAGTAGGDMAVGHRFVHHLLGTLGRDAILSGSAAVQETYAKIAHDLMTIVPEARYQGFNFSKREVINLEAGGPNSAKLAQVAKQLMLNAAARGHEATPLAQQNQDTGYTASSA